MTAGMPACVQSELNVASPGARESLGRLARRGNGDDRVVALEQIVEPPAVVVALGARARVLLRRHAMAAVEQLDQRAAKGGCDGAIRSTGSSSRRSRDMIVITLSHASSKSLGSVHFLHLGACRAQPADRSSSKCAVCGSLATFHFGRAHRRQAAAARAKRLERHAQRSSRALSRASPRRAHPGPSGRRRTTRHRRPSARTRQPYRASALNGWMPVREMAPKLGL